MNSTPTAHPSVDQLSAFAVGKLEPDAVDVIEKHLSGCPDCLRAVEQIKDDTFVGMVKDTSSVLLVPGDSPPQAETLLRTGGGEPGPQLPADLVLRRHPRYEVRELLGVGGMGSVYLAEHRMMRRAVALKVIKPQLVADQAAVERFQREVQAAARLHHPNIVTAFDAERAGDEHFLVMEYVKGTDLHRLLREGGPLPVQRACEYARQAALGLQHAHENGMVHRDIKPHNLMLTPEGQVKILDFGLAALTAEKVKEGPPGQTGIGSQVGTLTQAGMIMGTPGYMAPEQARDARSADIRADVYSLGCTLYHLLTGTEPFPEGKVFDKIRAHAQHQPRPVGAFRGDLPPGLAEVLARMMARDPEARYQTPAEVAEALAPFTSEGKGIKRAGLLRRRWPLFAALTGAGLLLLALCVALLQERMVVNRTGAELAKGTVVGAGGSRKPAQDDFVLLQKLEGHSRAGGRESLALSQDGKVLASCGMWGMRIWSLPSGKLTTHLRCQESSGTNVALAPDGKLAATTEFKIDKIFLWELPAGKLVGSLPTDLTNVNRLAFSPDGKWLAAAGYDAVVVWDVARNKILKEYHGEGYFGSICFTPDGKSLVVGNSLTIWDVAAGKTTEPVRGSPWLSAVGVSSDGKVLAGAHPNSYHITLWKLPEGKQLASLVGHEAQVLSVRFLPGDRYLLSGSEDGSIRLWDSRTGKEIARREGLKHLANCVLPLPDGRSAVSFGAWYLGETPDPQTSDWGVHVWRLPQRVWPGADHRDKPEPGQDERGPKPPPDAGPER